MQLWYVKDGQNVVGTSSIYTVGKFDGLVLVIDQYAGSVRFPSTQNTQGRSNIRARQDTYEPSSTTDPQTTNPTTASTASPSVTANTPSAISAAPHE